MRIKNFLLTHQFYLPLFLFPFILFSEALLLGKTLFWGAPSLQFIPWRSYAFQLLSEGQIPLWNIFNGMGAPLLANYQSAIFYPPSWLLYPLWLAGGTPWMAWGCTFLAVAHLVWACFGMSKLGGLLGFSPLGRVVSGLAFGLSGYFVARMGFFSMIWVGAWMPWVIVYASSIAFPGNSRVSAGNHVPVKLIISLSMQLFAGHAQLTWYTWMLGGLWVIAGGVGRGGFKGAVRALCLFIIAVLVSMLVAGVQLLPTAELLGLSQRAERVGYETAMTYSFWPWRFITFIAPEIFGNPGKGTYWGYASHWEDAVYLGLLPLFMAFFAFVSPKRDGRGDAINRSFQALIWFSGIVLLVGGLFALGKNTPVFPFLYRYIPTFDMFNAPARYMIWAVFSLSLLAGAGMTLWRKPEGRWLYWLRLFTAGGVAIIIGALITRAALKSVRSTFLEAAVALGVFAFGVGLLAVFTPAQKDEKRYTLWAWLILFWIGMDLMYAGWYLNPIIDKSFYAAEHIKTQLAEQDINGQRFYMSLKTEYDMKYKYFFSFDDYGHEERWGDLCQVRLANINILDSSPLVNNYDPLLPNRYVAWMQALEMLAPEQRDDWLSMMNVGKVIVRPAEDRVVEITNITGKPAFAKWYSCAQFVWDEKEAYQLIVGSMHASSSNAASERVVLEDAAFDGQTRCNAVSKAVIWVNGYSPQRIELTIQAEGQGWVLIADAWYPGWNAYLDGAVTKVYAGNYLFKAVEVPDGTHSLVLSYAPASFAVGAILSCVSLLGLLFVFALRYSQAKRNS
ncbi:MAG: YfhO family protein [Anaerolineae bacterium]|nr:YfhO family protein [Anaerolineae bacterium]